MAKVEKYEDTNMIGFYCPGCKVGHEVTSAWQFNDDFENPTFSPSILVTWPANPNAIEKFKEWRTERRCHSFIKEGKIQFLDDCTHPLKGQTVELPEL